MASKKLLCIILGAAFLLASAGGLFARGTPEPEEMVSLSFWNMPFVTQEVSPE
jgi:hypothetical protein